MDKFWVKFLPPLKTLFFVTNPPHFFSLPEKQISTPQNYQQIHIKNFPPSEKHYKSNSFFFSP